MSDQAGRYERSESWTSAGSAKTVLSALRETAEARGGRIEQESETEADLLLGSRTSYRIWGMFSSVKSRPMRLHLSVSPTSTDAVRVSVEAMSDPGWYAVNVTPLSSRQFEKAFDQLFDALRQAAPETPD